MAAGNVEMSQAGASGCSPYLRPLNSHTTMTSLLVEPNTGAERVQHFM